MKKQILFLVLAFLPLLTFFSCNHSQKRKNEIEVKETIFVDEPETLSYPDSRTNDGKDELIGNDNVFPTQSEIEEINSKLPVLVSEGTLNTKVEYDDRSKVQTFYYRFTQEVDESLITEEIIQQLKSNMIAELKKDTNNIIRLNAGMTFLYVYYSMDNRKLYEITINANDL